MKRKYQKISLILILIIIFNLNVYAQGPKKVKVLFTHDLHDRIEDYRIYDNNEIKNIGGFERLASLIKKERTSNSLLVDAGDYSMGTLYQTIFTTEAPSLKLLGKLGYDAVSLGNHEFDFRANGLAKHLRTGKDKAGQTPDIVFSNIDFRNLDNVKKEEVEKLSQAFDYYGVKEYQIIEKSGIKIGIFGILGKEAISNAPMAGVNFKDPIETAQEITRVLKDQEGVDLIVALSHSGTSENVEKSEDEILAKKVPDIDLIVSGHSHTTLTSPIKVNDTYIVSSGRYGENLGVIELVQAGDSWQMEDYRLMATDIRVKKTVDLSEDIAYYREKIQENYLDKFGLEYNQVLAKSEFNFTPSKLTGKFHGEDILGNFIADAFKYTVKEIEGRDYKPITASIVPAGTVRDSFVKGDIYVPDVFNTNSLGIGADKVSGYPLIDAYLTGEDLKRIAEVDASIAPIKSVAQLYMSGLKYSFNPNRLIFNKVTDIYIDQDGEKVELEKDKLYRVVAGLYTGQMLSLVHDQSYGILPITPRDEKGNPIENFEDRIIYKDGVEVKEWLAIANYLTSFKDSKGHSVIPKTYNEVQGRKVIENKKGLLEFLKSPNKFAKLVYFVFILLIIVLGILLFYLYKRFMYS